MYVSLTSVMLQTMLIWYFCYHSQLVTTRMSQISDFAFSVNWYRFPNILQRCTLLLIQQSNKRFAYSGFGIMQCDMQTLSMVCFTFNWAFFPFVISFISCEYFFRWLTLWCLTICCWKKSKRKKEISDSILTLWEMHPCDNLRQFNARNK